MINEVINTKLLNKISLEITERYKLILELFPKENEHILRHLAASSIHMAFFMRDLAEISTGESMGVSKEEENKFINTCGCDFNKGNK